MCLSCEISAEAVEVAIKFDEESRMNRDLEPVYQVLDIEHKSRRENVIDLFGYFIAAQTPFPPRKRKKKRKDKTRIPSNCREQ